MHFSCVCMTQSLELYVRRLACIPLASRRCAALTRLQQVAHASLCKHPAHPLPCRTALAADLQAATAQERRHITPALTCTSIMHCIRRQSWTSAGITLSTRSLQPWKPSLRPLHGHHARRQRRANIRRRLLPVRAQAGMHGARLAALRRRPRAHSPSGRRCQALIRV